MGPDSPDSCTSGTMYILKSLEGRDPQLPRIDAYVLKYL